MNAFEDFKKIDSLQSLQEKHREWLKRYEGLKFGRGVEGHYKKGEEWTKTKYSDKKFDFEINLVGRLPNESRIEFDGDEVEAKIFLEQTAQKLKENKWGFIRSTHKGKSDYLWIQFNRNMKDGELRSFLEWIAPEGSTIDENFASSEKVFPCLYAVHWKHSYQREIPIEFFEGEQIDFDSLNIKPSKKFKRRFENKENGFEYETAEKKEIKFDFDFEKSEVKNIDELESVIKKYFPTIVFETKACASTFASLSLKHLNGCPSLNLVGSPSGEKTTALSFFYNHELSYVSDDFTPKSFVSHSANVKEEELEAVDLLPKLKNRVLISPELAPLFESQKDKLLDNFAILTRVLDGEGLNRDSGVHGHRGYSGDYKFGWLGATTPLKANVWNVMGKIGNRLFFLNMRDKHRDNQDYLEMFTGEAYEKKVKICRGAVKSFLEEHFKKYPVRSYDWDAEQDILLLPEIIKYAKLLSRLRGTLMIWKGEGDNYQYSFPIIEEPPRAINSLYNFAKGHALINGRTFIRNEDLKIVREITFSSMPHDRFEFLKLLIRHDGKLTTAHIQKELNCSDETARRTMEVFKILGVVTVKSLQIDSTQGGRPMQFVEINPEFSSILGDTQVLKDVENSKPHESWGVYDDFSVENFVKNQKNNEKKAITHPLNNVEKSIPDKINPVLDAKSSYNPFSTDEKCTVCGTEAKFTNGNFWFCSTSCFEKHTQEKGAKNG